ncbi:MAG: glycosyltransferase, partial [Acidimicrobiales bacterium]|nr:glycosyltransferase [Acidimicrobiales bacterium]
MWPARAARGCRARRQWYGPAGGRGTPAGRGARSRRRPVTRKRRLTGHRRRRLVQLCAVRPLVVLPTYNEAENIEEVLGLVRAAAPEADILVVDDGSPDGTADLA